jgi:hypothetical protein
MKKFSNQDPILFESPAAAAAATSKRSTKRTTRIRNTVSERQTALMGVAATSVPDLPALPAPAKDRVKTGHTLAVVDKIERACELRRAGLPYRQIAELMGISIMRAHQLVDTAKRERVMVAADALIEYELEQLEILREKALEIMNESAPLVNAGSVITDTVTDPATGRPTIDPRTGEPLRVRLTDRGPALQALAQLVKISSEIRRLKGADSPKRTEVTTTAGTGGPQIIFASGEEYRACLEQALASLRPRVTVDGDVTDVEARPAL